MTYALLQETLDAPSTDKLRRAFLSSGVLTALDASIVAQDAFGILVKNLPAERAMALQSALLTEGVKTELVPDRLLPPLPPTKFVRKLQSTPEALLLHDALGRPFPLEWRHLMLVAAGSVRVVEFKQERKVRRITGFTEDGGEPVEIVDYSTREERNHQFLVEIIITRALQRYSVEVNKTFLAQFLGERMDADLGRSFVLFVRELMERASNAVANRGVRAMRAEPARTLFYPSKNAFMEEIQWILWRLGQGAAK